MEKILFITFFIAIPLLSIIVVTSINVVLRDAAFWPALEASFPIIVFYYLALSIVWISNVEKIRQVIFSSSGRFYCFPFLVDYYW